MIHRKAFTYTKNTKDYTDNSAHISCWPHDVEQAPLGGALPPSGSSLAVP